VSDGEQGGKIVCPRCGCLNQNAAEYCRGCGYDFHYSHAFKGQFRPNMLPLSPRNRGSVARRELAVVGGFLLCSALAGLWSLSGKLSLEAVSVGDLPSLLISLLVGLSGAVLLYRGVKGGGNSGC
jgi:hypothetical protein